MKMIESLKTRGVVAEAPTASSTNLRLRPHMKARTNLKMSVSRISLLSSIIVLHLALASLIMGSAVKGKVSQSSVIYASDNSENLSAVSSEGLVAMTAESRQQHGLKVSPQSANKKSIKLIPTLPTSVNKRAATSEQQQQQQNAQSTKKPAESMDTGTQRVKPSGKPKISNAKLKKLLEQSLLKAANGTQIQPTKGSNFKLVFIQRATASPSSSTSRPPSSSSSEKPELAEKAKDSASYDSGRKSPPKQTTSHKQHQYQSLAASVSKQLANSLLYSAANFVSNLTSSTPSLTSLVAQTLANVATTQQSEPSGSTEVSSFAAIGENLLDIKRISQSQSAKTKKIGSGSRKNATTGAKSRPSKIYNLPVKFVSNGQPNGVMFSHIKNSFATIKKLQSATNLGGGQSEGGSRSKKKKQQMINRLKSKGNSRLIYLPLKYLSNAKPNRLSIVSRATHKANDS